MAIKLGMNGFGRIGRCVMRLVADNPDFEVVGVNARGKETAAYAMLLKYDSAFGRFEGTVETKEKSLLINGKEVIFLSESTLEGLNWKKLGVEMVLENTGVFRKPEELKKHLDAGADRVVLSAPAKGEIDATIVMGVNDDTLTGDERIVSNASCTTNCIAPIVKVLHNACGIEHGIMTTIHAYTNDQMILDKRHKKDYRRARAAAANIIPTTTGAAKAVGIVIPELKGKLDGMAIRVPVITGSIVDLNVIVSKPASAQEINKAFREAAEGPLKGIIEYTEDPIVSSDVIGSPYSAIFDAGLTMVKENMVKVCGWYDNEWGYSARTVDLMAKLGSLR